MIGQVIDGKYQILKRLGQGRMGEVYEAVNIGTGRHVAIKLILGGYAAGCTDHLARFEREARAAGSVNNPHVVEVLDIGRDRKSGLPFLVMELLVGEDLQKLLERTGPLPVNTALRILAQACTGLEQAHGASIIHRDIKPANIFLAQQSGDQVVVKLLDFGIAKMKVDPTTGDSSLTQTGRLLGSPRYMSPEQVNGVKNIDARTDIWSLGVVAYELLTNQTPHRNPDMLGQLLMAICTSSAGPVQTLAPWVPPEVAAIVHRALAIKLDDRFQTTSAMLEELRVRLPRDIGLSRAMLVPLSAAERRHKARVLVMPGVSMGERWLPRVHRSWRRMASSQSASFGLAFGALVGVTIALSLEWKPAPQVHQPAPSPIPISVAPIPTLPPPQADELPPVPPEIVAVTDTVHDSGRVSKKVEAKQTLKQVASRKKPPAPPAPPASNAAPAPSPTPAPPPSMPGIFRDYE